MGAGVSEDAGACADEPALLLPPPLPEGVLPPPDELPELLLEGPFLRQSQPAGQWASCFLFSSVDGVGEGVGVGAGVGFS